MYNACHRLQNYQSGFLVVFSDYAEDGGSHQGIISHSCLMCLNGIISLLYCNCRFYASQFSSIFGDTVEF